MNYKSASAVCGLIIVVFTALLGLFSELGLSFSEQGRSPSTETRDSDSSRATSEFLLRR